MKWSLLQGRLADLLRQRNLLLVICSGLGGLNILQGFALLAKSETVVLVPPELSAKVWIKGNQMSPSYIEEMAVFLSGLFLTMTPTSASYQREVVLRYVDPAAYSVIKGQLIEDEERLKKESLATSFTSREVQVDKAKGIAYVTGDLMGYVGHKRIFQHRRAYKVVLSLSRGQVQLKSFTRMKERENA